MYAELVGQDVWKECLQDEEYEIHCSEPFEIRKKETKRIIHEYNRGTGYICVTLNLKKYQKHVLIATHFISNPNNLPCVDHINHQRDDNRLQNLRWVSRSENHKNRSSYGKLSCEYFDELDDEAIEINSYGKHDLEFYYYSEKEDSFYYYTGVNYRKMHVCFLKSGIAYVTLTDTEGKKVQVRLNVFKRLYDIQF
ncbi:HNH endonuclease family [Trichomonas vaginalis G3]|uniref:HNH endonuclease family n=1 Tax=Trichomonas vaginalis (strain ATCC PRA-98 / G3) TaxID=412133 RepID=UPI0021E5F1DC|nr:HNH endonuclease family [Trichomonas vaginalis G3]XP_051082365.1 HNH endonuclease family [Trichomonas vaginalis G3]KAI5491772.1 HNH endonuclease family [Trichomonas vaginalis G3]KAI5495785.1 HNH endonuclease family [Trichomonas vaginalis G3]